MLSLTAGAVVSADECIDEIEYELLLIAVDLLPQLREAEICRIDRDSPLVAEEIGERHAQSLADDLELVYRREIAVGVPRGYGGLGDAGFLGQPVDGDASVAEQVFQSSQYIVHRVKAP